MWGWGKDRFHARRVVIEHARECARKMGVLKDMFQHRTGNKHLKSPAEANKWLDEVVPLEPPPRTPPIRRIRYIGIQGSSCQSKQAVATRVNSETAGCRRSTHWGALEPDGGGPQDSRGNGDGDGSAYL